MALHSAAWSGVSICFDFSFGFLASRGPPGGEALFICRASFFFTLTALEGADSRGFGLVVAWFYDITYLPTTIDVTGIDGGTGRVYFCT